MKGPLAGLKVVDLSRAVAGPFATMMLADMGADVVKVESLVGELGRSLGPPYVPGKEGEEGESAYFLSVNRNKRSLSIDMRSAKGIGILRRLIAGADVLIENFRPGVLGAMGLNLDSLRKDHPALITCSISGYGADNDWSDRAAFDFLIQAESGLMSITGEPSGEPMKLGVAITDLVAALSATSGILAALHERQATGQGQHVDLALFDTALASLLNVGQNFLVTGVEPRRYGNAHPNIVPYQLFKTLDGYFAVSGGGDAHFKSLCEILGLSGLEARPEFLTNRDRVINRDALIPILSDAISKRSSPELFLAFRQYGLPGGMVNTVGQALNSSHSQQRGILWTISHPTAGAIQVVGNPLRFGGVTLENREHPPLLGEHTREVLGEIGLVDSDVQALIDSGIVRCSG